MRWMNRKWLAFLLSSILIFTNFFSLMPNQALAAKEAMTVAEAIANNSGTGTVEGYVVGYATGTNAVSFTAPFKDDTNFLIADSADEKDSSKLLPVQISKGFRTQFGLSTNPGNIGKKVKVTGSLEAYFKMPGLKSPTAIEFIQDGGNTDPGNPDPGVMTIAAARALNDGDSVVLTGVATTASGAFGSKGFYMQDNTAGIYVYQSSIDVKPGDQVKITGTKSVYNREVQISATGVEIIGTASVPSPAELTPATVTSDAYGELVKLSGVTVSGITDVGTYGSYSFYAKDGNHQILIYVDNRTGRTKSVVSEGLVVNVIGVVAPYGDSLEIKPTGVNDIIPVSPGGSEPGGSGKKVLFDNTHGETAGAADWVIDGGFSDFADGLRKDGFTVNQLEREFPLDFSKPAITLAKLQDYDVFIIGEANIPFKTSEQEAMLQYVQGGGSIFFIGDHYNADRNLNRWDSAETFNGYRRGAFGDPTKGMSAEEASSGAMQNVTSTDWLGTNFGIRFRYNALGDIESGQTVVPSSESFGITEGVRTVEMHAGGTLAILDPSKAKGLVYMPKNPPAWNNAVDQGVYNGGGIDEGPFAAIAKVGKGKAAFIGDSSPVEDASPKYVREDDGKTKKTYNGFLEEGDNSEFLVQTVEWLAQQEDYTSFEGRASLSTSTPLLDFEDPAKSTEPKTEPWKNPSGGYKWYDASTFAAGSYGSGSTEPKPPTKVVVPGVIAISQARTYAPDSVTVTVEGTITSTPGAWGKNAFYLQDDTGGIYIFQEANGYKMGQKVAVTGDVTRYNDEFELTNVKVTVKGTETLPQPKVVTTINADNQGQVVKLVKVKITGIENKNESVEFNAVNGQNTTRIRIDSRTGVNYSAFTAKYSENDILDITGISSIFKGTYQLKPRFADDMALANSGSDLVNVELIGLNDLHGKIDQHYELDINGDKVTDGTYGGAEYFAGYIRQKQQVNPNALFVGVGDLIGGSSPVSAMFQDEPTVEILNSLGMAVNVVGNHEFDEGTTELLRMVKGGDYPGDNVTRDYSGMNNAELAANVVWKSGPNKGESILPAYKVEEVGGQKIGFIGVVTKSAADMVMPTGIQDIEFTDPVKAINGAVTELNKQGIHAIVVLAHSAAEQAKNGTITGEAANYAGRINADVDVIFAAHNHMVVNGTVGDNGPLIVQASEYGKALSDVQLTIDPSSGDITKKEANIVWMDHSKITPDPEVSQILSKYQTQVAPLLNEVVGHNVNSMEGNYSLKGKIGDLALGNLIADSMKSAMNSDFAMMNGGGIRDKLKAGEITYGELFNILPFNNVLMKLEIKGRDLREIVNGQLTKGNGPDFSISGFKYTWSGSTFKAVDITLPDGSPIEPDATYTLAVNNFMATSTGPKYKTIGNLGKNPVMGPEDLEGLVSYVKSFKSPIDYKAEGRISQMDGDDPGSADFTIGKATFTNLAGEAVTALIPNGFIKANVKINNTSKEQKPAALIVALYDAKGSVKNLSYLEKPIGAGSSETFGAGFNLPGQIGGYYVKVFVWDGFGSMQPLSEAVLFPK